jgi:GNAT superfamily N-acetyltransferase
MTPPPAPPLRLETLTGRDRLAPLLPVLARLRIAVFRDWPYLYDGSEAYEGEYLTAYAASPGAAIVVAFDGEEAVGAATCQPMAEAAAEVRAGFTRGGGGPDPARVCYFGESVLLPRYRGRGAGVGFFAAREAHARAALGLSAAAFCAVVRNDNDPRRPRDHVPLDAFWARRGFVPRPDLSCVMRWREPGDDRETPHSLGFWVKDPL